MAGHEVGNQVLLQAILAAQGEILLHKPVVHRISGLAHPGKHRIGNVLRGNLQLTGHMILHQLPEEGLLLLCQQIVKANAAADKYLLDPGDFPQLPQQRHIVGMVGIDVLAGGGVQALPPAAGTLGHLLGTGGVTEIGGGPPHIVDVALEVLVLHHLLRFLEDGLMTAYLDNSSLVEGQGAEGASAEAAPVAHQAEFYLFNGRNASQLFVAGVIGAAIGQVVHRIHFLHGQGLLRGILHHIFLAVGLCQPLGGEGVAVAVLGFEGFCVGTFILLQFLKGGEHQGGQTVVQMGSLEHRAVDIGDILYVHAGVQRLGNFHNAPLPHAIHQQIRLGVQ